jgi:ParB-like chromosome segregation protein Spo0J
MIPFGIIGKGYLAIAMAKQNSQQWPADKVERRPIDALIPYARNSRTHSDEQVAQIAASMREWGWTNPVLVDEDGGIIAGHGRVMAARKLGYDEVPCMVATGWTDAQKRAYVIADNKLALNADWDNELLKLEIHAIDEAGFELVNIGFTGSELDLLMFDADFAPGSEDDQGKLDQLDPKMVCCPECGHSFDSRGNEQS